MPTTPDIYIHPTAIVETAEIGTGTRIWAFVHVQATARIGRNCNLGNHCFIENGASIGDDVTVKNNVCVWEGVTIADGVFVGPNVAFTNDRFPRSPRLSDAAARYHAPDRWLETTIVARGCSIGANATILPSLRLGEFSMVGAGSVVTSDVSPHTLVVGSPARPTGHVCRCGQPLLMNHPELASFVCPDCGLEIQLAKLR